MGTHTPLLITLLEMLYNHYHHEVCQRLCLLKSLLAIPASHSLLLCCPLQGTGDASVASVLFQSVLLPLAAAGALLFVLVKNGRTMVDRPQLRPELCQPWGMRPAEHEPEPSSAEKVVEMQPAPAAKPAKE